MVYSGCSWCIPPWLVIMPKVFGSLSFVCSAYLIKLVMAEKKKNTYHRLIITMSILDMFYSLWAHIIGSCAMPEGTAPFSAGNIQTCDTQGFFITFLGIISVPMLNASLSTYYNLIIKYNWNNARIEKIEKWLHIVPILFGIIIAIIPLAANLYVPGTWGCWFANTQYPLGCDSAETCVRGWDSAYFFWPILVIILVPPGYVFVSMYMVYKVVRNLEIKIARYTGATRRLSSERELREQERKNTKKSRRVMTQSVLYSSAMFLVLLFPFISIVLSQIGLPTPIWIYTLFAIFNPAQGIFNLAIHLSR